MFAGGTLSTEAAGWKAALLLLLLLLLL